MRLVDTHAHLGDDVFDDDRDAVLERARAAGVRAIVTVGETLEDARKNLGLLETHPELPSIERVVPHRREVVVGHRP